MSNLPYAERRPSEGDHSLSTEEKRDVLAQRIATVKANLAWYARLLMSLEREEERLIFATAKPLPFQRVLAAQSEIVDEGVFERAVTQLAERRQA